MDKLLPGARLAARFLAAGLALFIALFAADEIKTPFSALALLMHLLPALVLAALAWLAWKRQYLAGVVYLGLGCVFWFFFGSRAFFVISGPVLFLGVLLVATAENGSGRLRETLVGAAVAGLLAVDFAALHDIAKSEPDPTAEYIVLILSAALLLAALVRERFRISPPVAGKKIIY
ncbi:MAG: hypothetical protein AB1439_00645 [candidate division FCPU426 bacterium]